MTSLRLLLILTTITVVCSYDNNIKTTNGSYLWINTTLNFWTANRFCKQQYDTTLASIHNAAKHTEIITSCNTNTANSNNCWIGLNNVIEQNNYAWTDDTKYDFPLTISTNIDERCIVYNSITDSWTGSYCTEVQYTFFCNAPNGTRSPTMDTIQPTPIPTIQPSLAPSIIPTPSPTQPPQYTLDVFYSPNEKYILIQDAVNWWKGRNLCEEYFGTNLAIISDEIDNMEAATLCINIRSGNYTPCWIGLNRIYGNYQWMDDKYNIGIKTNQLATYWQSNYTQSNGYCAFIDNTLLWNVKDCELSPSLILCDFPPPTSNPTSMPTSNPTTPTTTPTVHPTTVQPTINPTLSPSKYPTNIPSKIPTSNPTQSSSAPSKSPTKHPTFKPTQIPTDSTSSPTPSPTTNPSISPTPSPTANPTASPTPSPTAPPHPAPTQSPTPSPTNQPTLPTQSPTPSPTPSPTERPTLKPTLPTRNPTQRPTRFPTQPSKPPTRYPTRAPTNPCLNIANIYDIDYNDGDCQSITVYPQNGIKQSYKIIISMDLYSASSNAASTGQRMFAYWSIGGTANCNDPQIQIATDPKVMNDSQYLDIYERDNRYVYTQYTQLIGRCQYDKSISTSSWIGRSCGEFETCLDATHYKSYLNISNINAGDTYGILIDRRTSQKWPKICGEILNIELTLICNSNGSLIGSTTSAVVSIILFIICLLYMIPVLIWATLYFFAKNGTLPSLNRRKQAPFKQSLISIWNGTGKLQKIALLLEGIDLFTDFYGSILIMSVAATKPDPELWRFCGGWSIFALIMGVIFTILKIKILRRFMPCIAKWKKYIDDEGEKIKIIKQKIETGIIDTGKGEAEWTNKWSLIKKQNNRINKYLAHIIMFGLFSASIEDSIQCTIQFRLQWSSLVESQNGLQLYYNSNSFLWFKVILALFSMTYKLVSAITIRWACHQEGIDIDLKPNNVDSDRDDEEPLTARTLFFGKKGLIPGGMVEKETLLDANIIATARHFYQTGVWENPLIEDEGDNMNGDGTQKIKDKKDSDSDTWVQPENTHIHLDNAIMLTENKTDYKPLSPASYDNEEEENKESETEISMKTQLTLDQIVNEVDNDEKKEEEEEEEEEEEVTDDDDDDEYSENKDKIEFFEEIISYGDLENAKNNLSDQEYAKYEQEWKQNVMEFVQNKAKLLKNLTLKTVAKDYVISMFNDKNGYKKSMQMLQALNVSKQFHKKENIHDIYRDDTQAP